MHDDDTGAALPSDRLLTTPKACAYLNVSRQTLYRLHQAGHFPCVKISAGLTNWRLSDLRAYADSKTRRVRQE
ncbi:helix-turn-helix transcriptional regulator [Paracoccus ravus]|uniref:helix-turn-helix transcriptional regulator n=1 Tax=Paracoccus ravus TaxID=2447760 RepID=UPI00106DF769|nr:helix-turn-helix domain-containing protein [Paracoccus ravus]